MRGEFARKTNAVQIPNCKRYQRNITALSTIPQYLTIPTYINEHLFPPTPTEPKLNPKPQQSDQSYLIGTTETT